MDYMYGALDEAFVKIGIASMLNVNQITGGVEKARSWFCLII